MTDTPQVLLAHYLKTLKLPTFLREYDKVARQCAAEGVDYPRYLLRLAELELIDRERRMIERRIKAAKFPTVKSLDSFDFAAFPSLNKALVMELARSDAVASPGFPQGRRLRLHRLRARASPSPSSATWRSRSTICGWLSESAQRWRRRKKLAWPLRASQPLLAVERLVANDGWVASRVKAVSRRRRGPQARLYRACHPAILDHRGRRLTPATLLPPPSMRGFTPPVTLSRDLASLPR